MDPVFEIKAKLPIEELVGQYCQLQKKGRGFVCVCPFHQDKHPSMQVSPDKGIAYCFACSSGGDIFSFYEKIEGVDFRQALKDLGERTGVKVEGLRMEAPVQKDHKERLRECMEAALMFYQSKLTEDASAMQYLGKRGIPAEQIQEFGIGKAPDSFSDTYQHLLKAGFSRKEIVEASIGIQKDLQDEKIYDRFRNRIMFPICDVHGNLIAFGGRTLGDDDAKYINSGETVLYNKSTALYGLHLAKDAIRDSKTVILVEGYFDVLACHRVGLRNTIAVSGTALTEQHVKLLKRYAEKVVLCLDQDRAGQDAAERAFFLCSAEELPVYAVTLQYKDPDEAALADSEAFRMQMTSGGRPYIDHVIAKMQEGDTTSSEGKHSTLKKLLPLLTAIQSSVERGHYIGKVATLLGTTETALKEDIVHAQETAIRIPSLPDTEESQEKEGSGFHRTEITLGILLLYPQLRQHLSELIEPQSGFAAALYLALQSAPDARVFSVDMLDLPEDQKEKASILMLYGEHHGFADWSDSVALREFRKNCTAANGDLLQRKLRDITGKLQKARLEGDIEQERQLSSQYVEVLKLKKQAVGPR